MCVKRELRSFPNISLQRAQDGKAAMPILVQNPVFRTIAVEQKGGVFARAFNARPYLCEELMKTG